MSDFDDVLERLIGDPGFRAALAADPGGTLSRYDLSADERDLLHSQYSADPGGYGGMEERASKASLFGLIGPLAGMTGLSGTPLSGHELAGGVQAGAGHLASGDPGPVADQGLVPVGGSGAGQGLYPVDGGAQQGLDPVGGAADSGLYPVGTGDAASGLYPVGTGGDADSGLTDLGDHTPVDYHPHIDADGDGRWDQYTAVQHADGSVDISVDRNHDGMVDFIGHDRDGDGLVDSADYDEDFNGTFETHLRDLNGDGWLDARTVDPEPPAPHG